MRFYVFMLNVNRCVVLLVVVGSSVVMFVCGGRFGWVLNSYGVL